MKKLDLTVNAYYLRRLFQGLILFGASLVALSVFRFVLIRAFGVSDFDADLLREFYFKGLRFDAQLMACVFAPLFLILLTGLADPSLAGKGWLGKPLDYFAAFCLLLIFLLEIINIGFYGFYHRPLNSLFFSFFDESFGEIFYRIWTETPVVTLFLICLTAVFLTLLPSWFLGRYCWQVAPPNWFRNLWFVLVFLFGILIVWGGTGRHPLELKKENNYASTLLHDALINGPTAFWQARQESLFDKNLSADIEQEVCQRYGFHDLDEVKDTLAENLIFASLGQAPEVAKNLRQPNVMVGLIEGFSSDFFNLHQPGVFDTLGTLGRELEGVDTFSHAISIGNGTYQVLEGLLFDSPLSPIIGDKTAQKLLPLSVADEFRKAGYRTIFLTSGNSHWRDIDRLLKRQGFDEVLDVRSILKKFPKAVLNASGVADQYMYDYANDLLTESQYEQKPLFIVTFARTNSPPYVVPDFFRNPPISVEQLRSFRPLFDQASLFALIRSFQYAADSAGRFLQKLDASPASKSTIVVLTGNHNTRSVNQHLDQGQVDRTQGVPILFRVPKRWRQIEPDTSLWVGHRDIFSTLKTLALEQIPSGYAGRNLYAPELGFNETSSFIETSSGKGVALGEAGAVVGLNNPRFFAWDQGELSYVDSPSSELLAMYRRAAASLVLADLKVREELLKQKNGKGH